jgi:hypothetical protein
MRRPVRSGAAANGGRHASVRDRVRGESATARGRDVSAGFQVPKKRLGFGFGFGFGFRFGVGFSASTTADIERGHRSSRRWSSLRYSTFTLASAPNRSDNQSMRRRRTKCARLVVASAVPGLLGAQFLLRRGRTNLGRDATNHIPLSHRSVSARHAVITHDRASYIIADQRSTNGVHVNGNRYGKVRLRAGDYVDLGWVRFRFVAPNELFLFARDVVVTPLP